jgi:ectoine hydroxylase-related dioxygenase (phytanoyl-CoA dioxygenase family)
VAGFDQHLEAIGRDGYCVIENAFSDDYCDRAVDALHRIARDQSIHFSDQDFSGRKTVRVMNLLQYDALFREIPVHEGVLSVLERYLDRECLLSGIDSSEIHPGEVAQAIHTDTWWHDDRRFDFPVCVNTLLALTDFTEENGATRLVPGSHLWTAEQVAYDVVDAGFSQVPGSNPKGYGTDWTPVVAEVPKGSIIMWDSRILHGGGANASDSPRPSIISPYVLGWIRQLDNFAYGVPAEKARTFSPRLQELIGLDCYRKHYSQVNNMSPREWLWGRGAPQPA